MTTNNIKIIEAMKNERSDGEISAWRLVRQQHWDFFLNWNVNRAASSSALTNC